MSLSNLESPFPFWTREFGARFGSEVRRLRQSRRWSQEHFAGVAGINRTYMGEVERGQAMPTIAVAAKIAHALGLRLSDLIARCEAPWPSAPSRRL